MSQSFVHLRLHTEFSLVDSVARVPDLMQALAGAQMPAVALTDQSNLSRWSSSTARPSSAASSPSSGWSLPLPSGERRQSSRIALLCQSQTGYRNVTRLLSRVYLEGGTRCADARARLAAGE